MVTPARSGRTRDFEWSEHFYIHGVNVGVSAFLAETMDKWLADVVERFDTDDEKHMRVVAVQHAVPVHGDQQIARSAGRRLLPGPTCASLDR